MLRRQTRLRKEYLYRKSLEAREKTAFEKKQALKTALQEGRAIPTELRKEADALRRELVFDEDQNGGFGISYFQFNLIG